MKYVMEQGVTYLIKEPKPDDSLKVFAYLVKHGARGFCITRVHPKRIRKRFELGDTPILWITTSEVPDEKCVHPSDLAKLNMAINEMLKNHENLVILLEGIEYLVTYNGFDSILRFVQVINDRIMVTNSRFIITLDPATLDTGSLHILERDLVPIEDLGKLEVVFSELPDLPASEGDWRPPFQERLKKWKEQGLAVDRLGAALAGGQEEASKAFEQYETAVARMSAVQDELTSMDLAGFEKEAGALRARLLNPFALKEAEDELLAIQVGIERKKKDDTRKKLDDDKRREELRTKLRDWSAQGYNTSALGAVLNEPLDTVRKEFERFEASILKLRELNDELILMDTAGFESEVEGIRSRLTQPARVNEVEDDIFRLKILIERRRKEERRKREDEEKSRNEVAAKVDRWRAEGYDTSRLEGWDLKPAADARAHIESFEKDVAALKDLETELQTVSPRGLEADLERMKARLRNPALLPELKVDVAAIKKKAERSQEESRKDDVQRRILEWKVLGFNVDRFKQLENADPEAIQKELVVFKIRVHRLKELESELALMDTSGLEREVSAIQPLFKDVDRIPDVESRLMELRIKVKSRSEEQKKGKDERARLKHELVDKMSVWLSQGHSVARLEEVLGKEKDLDKIVSEFNRFEKDIVRQKELSARLKSLDVTGFEGEAEQVRTVLADLSKAGEAEAALAALEARVRSSREDTRRLSGEEEKRKRKAQERIDALRAKGIDVSSLQKALDEGWEVFRNELSQFSLKLEKLSGIKEELASLEARGFEKEVAALRERLSAVDRADETEQEFKALRARIDQKNEQDRSEKDAEKNERNSYLQKLLAWSSQGIAVDRLEKMIDQPMDALRPEFERFERGLKRLQQMRQELLAMDLGGFEEEAAALQARMNRPEEVGALETEMAALRSKLEKRHDERGENELRRAEIRDRVASLKAVPLNVSRIEGLLDGDMGTLEKELELLMASVKRLRGARKRLTGLETRGFEDRVSALGPLLQEPERAEELEAEVDKLAGEIDRRREAESARRRELMAKVDEWAGQGINVTRLLEVSEGELATFERTVNEFEQRLGEMRAMEEKLQSLKKTLLHADDEEVAAEKAEESEHEKREEEQMEAEDERELHRAEEEVEEEVQRIRGVSPEPGAGDRARMELKLRGEHRAQMERLQHHKRSRGRRNLIAAVCIVVILMMSIAAFAIPRMMAPSGPGGIQIDGKFDDWDGIAKDKSPADPDMNPSIDIIETAAVVQGGELYCYVKTAGTILKGWLNATSGNFEGDTLRIYIDSDSMLSTGYQISGIGADHVVQIYGWNNMLQGSMYYLGFTGDPQAPWRIIDHDTPARAADEQLEVKIIPSKMGLTHLGPELLVFELRDSAGDIDTAG